MVKSKQSYNELFQNNLLTLQQTTACSDKLKVLNKYLHIDQKEISKS